MIFKLIGHVYGRINYELDRARRIFPTAVRFGVSHVNERMTKLVRSLERWSQSCDHTTSQSKRRSKKKTGKKSR